MAGNDRGLVMTEEENSVQLPMHAPLTGIDVYNGNGCVWLKQLL